MLSAEEKAEIPIAEFIEDVASFCQVKRAALDTHLQPMKHSIH